MNNTPLTDANTLATGQLSLAQTTLESEYGAYFAAEDARARAYLTAYVNEALADAAFASARAQNRATAYAQKLGEVENAVDAAKLHGDGRSVVLKSVNESESGAGVSLDGLEKLKRLDFKIIRLQYNEMRELSMRF